jgi:hypothetical protein
LRFIMTKISKRSKHGPCGSHEIVAKEGIMHCYE